MGTRHQTQLRVIECLRLMTSDDYTAGIVLSYLEDGVRDEWDCSLAQAIEAGFGGRELQIAARTALGLAEYHAKGVS